MQSILETESRSGILDTLPEEKISRTNEPMQYKRVYPDWKPTIDKTDVVGVMEAIEGKRLININYSHVTIFIELV